MVINPKGVARTFVHYARVFILSIKDLHYMYMYNYVQVCVHVLQLLQYTCVYYSLLEVRVLVSEWFLTISGFCLMA